MKTLTYLNNSTVHSLNANYYFFFFSINNHEDCIHYYQKKKKKSCEKDFDSRIELRLVLKKKFFFCFAYIKVFK
jgi:hypothetical protein